MLAIGLLISVSILFGLYNAILLLNRGIAPTEPLRRVLSNEMVAPDFTLTAQDGRAFHLADYKGRAVFLAFVPRLDDTNSTTLIRSLKTSVGDFDRAGAKVFVVSPEPKETAQAFYQREKLPFPILHDAEGRVRMQYTIPEGRRTTFVVDPVGKVRYRIGDAMIEAERHGKQLLDISKCCMDDIIAARAGGIGKPVGDYSLPRAESGQMETLYGDGTQKATVIAFISVKCPCSNTYNDRLRTIAAEYSKQGVRFVGVYANSDESAKEIATHATEQRFPFIALRDERGLCADHFRAAVTPQVFVIDSQRILRYGGRIDDNREETAVTAEDLRDALEAVLKGGTVPEETLPFGCAIVRDTLADDKPSTTERPAGNE
jgi:peroxiredoxin